MKPPISPHYKGVSLGDSRATTVVYSMLGWVHISPEGDNVRVTINWGGNETEAVVAPVREHVA